MRSIKTYRNCVRVCRKKKRRLIIDWLWDRCGSILKFDVSGRVFCNLAKMEYIFIFSRSVPNEMNVCVVSLGWCPCEKLDSVFTWLHGGHVGVPNYSSGNWTLFLGQRFSFVLVEKHARLSRERKHSIFQFMQDLIGIEVWIVVWHFLAPPFFFPFFFPF